MTKEIEQLLTFKMPLPKGTLIVETVGGKPNGTIRPLTESALASANKVPNHLSETEPFWIHGWKDLHDNLSLK